MAQHAVGGIAHAGVFGYLPQALADEREARLAGFKPLDTGNARYGLGALYGAAKPVERVGRIDDYPVGS